MNETELSILRNAFLTREMVDMLAMVSKSDDFETLGRVVAYAILGNEDAMNEKITPLVKSFVETCVANRNLFYDKKTARREQSRICMRNLRQSRKSEDVPKLQRSAPKEAPQSIPTTGMDIPKVGNTTGDIPVFGGVVGIGGAIPPSKDMVDAYFKSGKFTTFTVDEFIDYYNARGWLVNGVKMKDWKAVMRNWERRGKQRSLSSKNTSSTVNNNQNGIVKVAGGRDNFFG